MKTRHRIFADFRFKALSTTSKTEYRGPVFNIPASISGGTGLKSQHGYPLSWKFSWFSSVNLGKFWDRNLKLGHTASFHILSYLYFTYHHFIRRYIVLSHWKVSLNKVQGNKQITNKTLIVQLNRLLKHLLIDFTSTRIIQTLKTVFNPILNTLSARVK
jgi:hypothetical protein